MTDSMMPEGVEHPQVYCETHDAITVTDSMMPEGVEHIEATI